MINNYFQSVFASILIGIPVYLYYANLPIKLWYRNHYEHLPVQYTKDNEPLTINLEASKINFDEYI